MPDTPFENVFNNEALIDIFPPERADSFFAALYGDASEGAYNIQLRFKESRGKTLVFEFHLNRRPDKCLKCSLTYGLPKVFQKHPVIDLKGVIERINAHLDGRAECVDWEIDGTREISADLHVIPLTVYIK